MYIRKFTIQHKKRMKVIVSFFQLLAFNLVLSLVIICVNAIVICLLKLSDNKQTPFFSISIKTLLLDIETIKENLSFNKARDRKETYSGFWKLKGFLEVTFGVL